MKFICASTTAFSLAAALAGAALAADSQQHDVARRGAQVMPFQLSATTHVFTKTADGGTQRVVAKKPEDTRQITLIRAHLKQISEQFARGDFSAPAHIHGTDMPGLATLRRKGPASMQMHYRDIAEGGEITYSSADPEVRAALHQWFDAQLSDHGHDAMQGHDHSMMHR